MNNFYFELLLYPAIIFFSAVLTGFLLEKILMARLRILAGRSAWKADDMIIHAVKGMPFAVCLIAGVYFAIHYMPVVKTDKLLADKILLSFLIVILCVLLIRILTGFVSLNTGNGSGKLPSTSIIANIIRMTVFLLGFLIILQSYGISVTPLLTALGVGGLAVALALQDTLSNLFSGLQVIASRQIRISDYIKIDSGEEGYVTDINWRNTTIRALQNHLIVIPNSKMASAILVNYNLPDKEIAVLVNVGVSYGSDLELVEQTTCETAKQVLRRVAGGVKAFEPFIRYNTFADSSINFTVILRAEEFVDQHLIKHEFIKELHKKYRKNNIEIPFPIRTIHIKQDK